ncbi:thioesterase domain-containing protein [Streptantibioticus silvisoli]|uniref:Alpha/beta fold hydrolase n=1 Tax=Streptantibioticus silvisoli TaxID=2705255 RepID=A0ABT6VS47_9ACTN|nr:alpha/beta fold hydrolase [Streptantibioticus silvisoli]MDI5961303.1 alpha/beta fold hydrolase [Streptantibioticus silvisoli]
MNRGADHARTVLVVGAGATGLTLARALHRAGHRPIVVDAAATLGGKSASVHLDGRAYDLGGHFCTSRYSAVERLAAELGVATEDTTPYAVHEPGAGASVPLGRLQQLGEASERYAALRAERFPSIAQPGLAHSARALARPITAWLAEHRLEPLWEALGAVYSGSGYGDPARTPALYFAKFVELSNLAAAGTAPSDRSFTIAGGFGRLWHRLADELPDVRLGVRIERIERNPDGVRVKTADGLLSADDLVLTVPLAPLLPVLDSTAEERELAARIRHIDYRTVVFTAAGLPRSRLCLLRPHSARPVPGRLAAFHHRYDGSDVYSGYVYDGPEDDEGRVVERLEEDVTRLGGRLTSVLSHHRWAYMPHFSGDDLAAGIMDRLEQLQGRRRTYHAGSLAAFELVECNVRYAQQLAERFFAAPETRHAAPSAPHGPVAAPRTPRLDRDGLADWLSTTIATELDIPAEEMDPTAPLDDYPLDSITVASLQAALSARIGRDIPLAELLDRPTIAEMAEHFAQRPDPRELNSRKPAGTSPLLLNLTPLRPFFCAGGAVGTTQYLRPLARELGQGRPFYALQAPGYDGTEEPLARVEERAERYAEAIRQVQPHGPYTLGGHSFGGCVAYETALRLRGEGEEVAGVVLIDTYLAVPGQAPPPEDETAAIEELMTMHRLTDPGSRSPARDPLGGPDADTSPEQLREQLARFLGASGTLPFEEFVVTMLSVYQASLEATVHYRPAPSDLPVTLIKAMDGFPPVLRGDRQVHLCLDDPNNGWDPEAMSALRTLPTPGNHFTVFRQPQLRELAETLRHCLR